MKMLASAARRAAPLAALLLAACAGGPSVITLPDGSIAYRIDCDGTARGLNYCLEMAGKSCGAEGYTIVAPDGRRLTTSEAVESDTLALFKDYAADRNSILIQCGT